MSTRNRNLMTLAAVVALGGLARVAAAAAPAAGETPTITPGPGTLQVITTLTTLIIFGLLLAVLGKYAWGPIVSGLKKREEKIRREIAEAEQARARAEQTLAEYNTRLAAAETQVREMIERASRDAQQISDQIKTRAEQEAQERKERVVQEIERAKADALNQIYEQTAVLATSVAEKILQRNLNPDDQRDLVNRSLDQLGTVGRN